MTKKLSPNFPKVTSHELENFQAPTIDHAHPLSIQRMVVLLLVSLFLFSVVSCARSEPVYWSKPGAPIGQLERDKHQCQQLAASNGQNEEGFLVGCLWRKGWVEVAAPSHQ